MKGLEHMPNVHSPYYMHDYMKEYRQGKLRTEVVKGHVHPGNPARREKLNEANRLNTFKWRISKLLSPRYEILLCIQYRPEPEYCPFNENEVMIHTYSKEECNDIKEVIDWFPVLNEYFIDICNTGGEIFKVFLLEKYSRKFDWFTDCLV